MEVFESGESSLNINNENNSNSDDPFLESGSDYEPVNESLSSDTSDRVMPIEKRRYRKKKNDPA